MTVFGDFAPVPRPVETVSLSDAGVRGLGALPLEPPSPRAAFLERARTTAERYADRGDASVESWIRRELQIGLMMAVAEADADMLFGEGRDGTEPSELRGLLPSTAEEVRG